MNLTVLVVLLCVQNVISFNFDTDFPIVFQKVNNVKHNTYFGYSVAMYNHYGTKWIRIGAPKGGLQNKRKNEPLPGTVYNCDRQGCRNMNFIQNKEEDWKYQSIGSSIAVSNDHRVVTCAYGSYYFNRYLYSYEMIGACFWSFANSTEWSMFSPLLQYKALLTKYIPGEGTAIYYGLGEAGFSMHFPEKEKGLLLGAPGIFNWIGTPLKVTDRFSHQPDANRRRREAEPFMQPEVPNPERYVNTPYQLFGYCVTSGYYYGPQRLYYAASSPKGEHYKGEVITFRFNKTITWNKILQKEYQVGETLGEYFGGSLETCNINNDFFDDLLVGAPYFGGNTFDQGKVYLFLGRFGSLQKATILKGNHKGGQFGKTIMCLEDINDDGFREVAIGAPYENENTGTVYIYRGTNDGLHPEPVQIIYGKDVLSSIRGFGISISKPVDMDENAYSDITVGSHISGHAVLIRNRPLVAIRYDLTTYPKILPHNTTNFTITLCFQYQMRKENHANITYFLEIDGSSGRALIDSKDRNTTGNVTIPRHQRECRDISVSIMDAYSGVRKPIAILFTYKLKEDETNKSVTIISDKILEDNDWLCIRCPILDKVKSNLTLYKTEVPFSLNCGTDEKCQSDITVEITFPQLKDNTLILGSMDTLKLLATVKNDGENAYNTELFLVLPEKMLFNRDQNIGGWKNDSALLLPIGNPLAENKKRTIELLVDVADFNPFDDHVDIYAKILTASENLQKETTLTRLNMSKDNQILISGKSNQKTNFYGVGFVDGTKFTHSYLVEKMGVSPINAVRVTMNVPHIYTYKNKNVTFLKFTGDESDFGDQLINCEYKGVEIEKVTQKIELEDQLNRRRRGVTEVFKPISKVQTEQIRVEDKEIEVSAKTLYLNCTTPGVTCFTVTCDFGPYYKQKTPAKFVLNLVLNNTLISKIGKDMDMVLISSTGDALNLDPTLYKNKNTSVHIYNHLVVSTEVSTVYINDLKIQKVALWIIILSAIVGLLLLIILTVVLIKMGFFKRTKKEELANLKAAAVQEDKIMERIEGSTNLGDEEVEEDCIIENQNEADSLTLYSSKEGLC